MFAETASLSLEIDFSWDDDGWKERDDVESLSARIARAVLLTADGDKARRARAAGAELSIVFTDDSSIRELNRNWRGKDAPTNVLSFPAMDDMPSTTGSPILLGDVVLARSTIEAEARTQAKAVVHHLAHLVCHGTLHLLDYDHLSDNDAARMESLETAILAGFGISDPYALNE